MSVLEETKETNEVFQADNYQASLQGIYLMGALSVLFAMWSIYNFVHIPSIHNALPHLFGGFYGFRHWGFGLNFDTAFFIGEVLFSLAALLQALMWTFMSRNPLAVMAWAVIVPLYFAIAYRLI